MLRLWTRGSRQSQERTYRARMPYADWAAVTRDLTTALDRLDDREFLIMGEKEACSTPRRRLFGRRTTPEPTRYVQVLRVGEVLSTECVGAVCLGGTWEMDHVTIEGLRGLGWLTPAESRAEFGSLSPNFALYVDIECTHELPPFLVATLAVLGARPEALVLTYSSGAAAQVAG
ncbi:MAG: hypothetical protein JWR90_2502 [Marmoricola sp.]|jgi:hypothetical protein|nr:hypothetical protein [Marmoricola sp.]